MYDELVKALRETDFSDGCPCGAEPLCKDKDCVILQAAEAIEELQGRAKVLEKVADKWCEAVPKWIPVTERLPEIGKDVLCFCRANIYMVLGWDGNHWHEGTDRYYMSGLVTHWMPLPEPPKEDVLSHKIDVKGNCTACGKPLGENDGLFLCAECQKKNKEQMIYPEERKENKP